MIDNFNVIDTLPDQILFDIRNSLIGGEEEYRKNIERYYPELERVKKEVRYGSYLDIGCGRGEMLEFFKQILPKKKCYGTDEMRIYLDICKTKRLPTMWMNPIERLHYVKGGYKAITCIHHLQYMRVGFIYEFLRLARLRLKRGGILILQIPNSNNESEVRRWRIDPQYINAYPSNLIEYLMRYVGFFAVDVQPHEDGKNITIIGTRKPYPLPSLRLSNTFDFPLKYNQDMIKSAFRTLVREKLDEATADLWTNTQLDDFADEELRTLPAKNVYKEEIWDTKTAVGVKEYPLPDGTIKVEKVEINELVSGYPSYNEQNGCDTFANVLYLPNRPMMVSDLRIWIKKSFTPINSLLDTQTLDIPDSKIEVLVLGTVLRAYSSLMGYFVDLKNWDYNAKPDGISMNQVQAWIRDVKTEYKEILSAVRITPKPRFIDLIG